MPDKNVEFNLARLILLMKSSVAALAYDVDGHRFLLKTAIACTDAVAVVFAEMAIACRGLAAAFFAEIRTIHSRPSQGDSSLDSLASIVRCAIVNTRVTLKLVEQQRSTICRRGPREAAGKVT